MGRGAVASMLAVVLVAGLVSSCSRRTVGASRLSVVAAESPWGAVAAAIGGDHVTVTSILRDASIDPHEYSPTAPVAAEVALARVVVDNGLGYDSFMDRLLGTGAAGERTVVNAASVLGVSGTEVNPHLWYAIERVPVVAAAIEHALAHADPAHRVSYEANLAAFDASLAPLDASLASIRAAHGGTPVAQTERVAGYLLAQAGLVVVSPPGFATAIEEGREPNAADTATMSSLLHGGHLGALVYNVQTQSALTDQVRAEAQRSGVPVVAVSELVEPLGASFVSWQGAQIGVLADAISRAGA